MSAPITIRNMNTFDVDAVFALGMNSFMENWSRDQYLYEVEENPVSRQLVATSDGEVIGFLVYWITFSSSTVCQIAVKKEFQNRGIASKLLNEMEKELKKEEVETITLEVKVNNLPAIALYKKDKYEAITIKKGYYSDGTDALYMMKVL